MSNSSNNFVLALLEPAERAQVMAASRPRTLAFKDVIFRSGEAVHNVVFPEAGVISLITQGSDGSQAEAAVIGLEGAAGLVEALGSRTMSTDGVVQAAGKGWFVPVSVCEDLYENSRQFRQAAALAAEFQALEARQAMLCRSFHVTEARLARWLLEMRDKSGGNRDRLTLTQEFLSMMLGVQRTTVSSLAHAMQTEGLIHYSRGCIELRDEPGLEDRACARREELRNHHDRITQTSARVGAAQGGVSQHRSQPIMQPVSSEVGSR